MVCLTPLTPLDLGIVLSFSRVSVAKDSVHSVRLFISIDINRNAANPATFTLGAATCQKLPKSLNWMHRRA